MKSLEENIIYGKLTGDIPINYGAQAEEAYASQNTFVSSEQKIESYYKELDQHIRNMDQTRENNAYRQLYSCRPVIGKLIVFAKRVVRKCLKWYLEPVCIQQTEFNNAVTPAIGRLCELQRMTQNKTEEMLHSIEINQQDTKQFINDKITQIQQNYDIQFETVKKDSIDLHNQLKIAAQQITEANNQLQMLRECGAFSEIVSEKNIVKRSTAQSGEDMISEYVTRVLGKKMGNMTYLDLGANHAKLYSNTYHFYQKGVRGVLVEANPALIGELKFYRSGDIILNRCIATTSGETVDFYVLKGDGLSTPDKGGADAAIAENPMLKIDKVVPVKTITVEEIIDTYFDKAPTIINLDIEGEEMNILNSIDFTKHRPLIMIIETIPYRKHLVVGLKNQEIIDFMIRKNYIEYAFTGINSIFLDKEQIAEVLE